MRAWLLMILLVALPAAAQHADWWNGWDQEFLAAIKASCHDKNRDCGQDNAPDGRRMNAR